MPLDDLPPPQDGSGAEPFLGALGDGPSLMEGQSQFALGGWLVRLAFASGTELAGPLRISPRTEGRIAISADLYKVTPGSVQAAAGLPTLPLSAWSRYMRVTGLTRNADMVKINWVMRDADSNIWQLASELKSGTAPPGYPAGASYLEGILKDQTGEQIASMSMGWLCPWLRQARVLIESVSGCPPPVDSQSLVWWTKVFSLAGWRLEAAIGRQDLPDVPDSVWSAAELHDMMSVRRSTGESGDAWLAYMLAVPNIEGIDRGLMFDTKQGGTDPNSRPREGAAVSSLTKYPMLALWGAAAGKANSSLPAPYIRTAMHEIGHVFSLEHNESVSCLMCSTHVLAAQLRNTGTPFPNLPASSWTFTRDQLDDLAHKSDRAVAPGGLDFGAANVEDSDPVATIPQNLFWQVQPSDAVLPLGAPLRVELELHNKGRTSVVVPSALGFGGSCFTGTVTDPAGTTRIFSPLLLNQDGEALSRLKARATLLGSATLWHGAEGPLFPMPGYHRIECKLRWKDKKGWHQCISRFAIMVTPASSRSHALAALAVLDEPSLHLQVALGGDHHHKARTALDKALKCKALRSHWLFIEVRRLSQRHFKRVPDHHLATRVLKNIKNLKCSRSEKSKLSMWNKKKSPSPKKRNK